jgi:hypothetical protein
VFENKLTGGLPVEYSVFEQIEMFEVDFNPLGGTVPREYRYCPPSMPACTAVQFLGSQLATP